MRKTYDFLENRAAELETRGRERGLDLEAVMRNFPDDPRARVARLATVLNLDALRSLQQDVTLDELEEESQARDEASKQIEGEMKELGFTPVPETS